MHTGRMRKERRGKGGGGDGVVTHVCGCVLGDLDLFMVSKCKLSKFDTRCQGLTKLHHYSATEHRIPAGELIDIWIEKRL
jgi:hypothetical protein